MRDVLMLRFIVIKERKNYYVCKDYNNNKYKLLKTSESKNLKIGDDKYHYIEKVGRFLFTDVIRLLSKKEEYELMEKNNLKSLHDLGLNIENI